MKVLLKSTMIRLVLVLVWCSVTVFCAQQNNKIRLPILHMPVIDWQPLSAAWNGFSGDRLVLAKKLVPAHLSENVPGKHTVILLYGQTPSEVQTDLQVKYFKGPSHPPSSNFTDINYYWSVVIPPSDLEGSVLTTDDAQYQKLGAVQEMMLVNITKQMSIDLSKVAARLSVPVRNLSYSYDPNKWEDIVHAMVAEGIQNYISYLDVANEDKLAALFGLTTTQLKNTTIPTFIDLLPPVLAKKRLIDNNKVQAILTMAGISTANSSNAVVYDMIKNTTNLTVVQFGSLYNLTDEQQQATKRSTLLQFSQSCGKPMSQLLDKNIPSVVWETIGNQLRSVSCLPMLKVKGIAISSLPGLTSPSSKTPLQILLNACDEYWKSCRFTMSLAPDEWECLDTQSLQQSTSIKGSPTENILLYSPVHDLVDVAYTACKQGQLSLNTYRDKVQSTLETMFNLTGSEVASLVNLSQSQISATASSLVKAFLKASSKDLGIGLNTMYNTSTKTIEELFESPVYELYEIIPYIIRSAVQTPASQLHMTDSDTLFILKLSADNATIAQYKYAAKYVLPNIIISKNKFENNLIGKLMTDKSISDNSILANTTLQLLLTTSGFDLDTMKTIYGMNDAQISVLSLLYIKDLVKHCNLDLAAIKSHSSYNLTALLVGIATKSATCKSTTFYVAAKAKQMQELVSVCSTVTSTTLPLMRMVERCTNLTWRYNARILGVNMQDWPQMDILTRDKLSQYSDLNKDKIKTSTLVSLLAKANSIHTTSDAYKSNEVPTYNNRTRSELYSVFSTNTEKMASILGFPKATIDSYSALIMVEKLEEFLKLKYTINLSSTASTVGVSLDKLKYLAPTEWHEMILTLKNEIVSSGSKQLSVTENNFKLLLALTDVAGLRYSNLQLLWDTTFKRLFTGKSLAENKTISTIQTMKGISLVALHKETPLTFYNKYLNLTKTDMSILFAVKQMDFDTMTRFTFKELPCSCKVSELQILGVTPLRLMSSMTGKSDVALCRSIAILEGFRSLSMDSLKTKFNVTWNDTQPLLIVAQSLSDLPYEKISWGLGSQIIDWPVLHAVSIDDYTKIASINTTALANLSFRNVSALIIQNKNSFASQLQKQHISLVKQASSMFNVSSTDVCGQCDIPSTDVLKKFLYHLGGILYLDPRVIPLVNGFDCITHDSFVLQPSKWRLLLPGIIPQSFKNISMILHNSENKLAAILGSSKSNISNLALHEYIQLVTSRIKPMVDCYRTVNTDNTLTKVLAKGKDISFMKQQTFIQTLSLICSDVNVYNMTSIIGWEGTNLSILQNYTMDDAALCKIMSIKSVLSRSMVALANMMINEVHNCVVIPCRSGTLRDQEYYNCTDVNECKAQTPVCKTNQMCQNYHGGHECECDTPGFCMDKTIMTCNKCLRFLLTITFDMVFTNDLEDLLSPGFYLVKEKIQKNVDNAFRKLGQYIRCRLIKLRKGSVIAETSVYTSSEYGGTSQDLEKYFDDNLNTTNGQSYLGDLKVKTALLSDYNECTRNQDNCHQYATCENKQGTFQCVCNSGYEGDGITCEAGFLKTYWWLVIVLAVILVIIIIVIIVLVVKKPRLKSYGVDEELPPIKRSDSNLSYQNGDVYYKDKAGNTRAGTQYNAVPAERTEPTNPIYGQDIPENVYESQSQWNQNIYALDNLGADKDDGIEMKPKTNPIKENNHPGVNGSTTQDQAL